jgi:hypothetical protein
MSYNKLRGVDMPLGAGGGGGGVPQRTVKKPVSLPQIWQLIPSKK